MKPVHAAGQLAVAEHTKVCRRRFYQHPVGPLGDRVDGAEHTGGLGGDQCLDHNSSGDLQVVDSSLLAAVERPVTPEGVNPGGYGMGV